MVSQTWMGGCIRFNQINLNRISDLAIFAPAFLLTLGEIPCENRKIRVSVLSHQWPAHCPDPAGNRGLRYPDSRVSSNPARAGVEDPVAYPCALPTRTHERPQGCRAACDPASVRHNRVECAGYHASTINRGAGEGHLLPPLACLLGSSHEPPLQEQTRTNLRRSTDSPQKRRRRRTAPRLAPPSLVVLFCRSTGTPSHLAMAAPRVHPVDELAVISL